MRKSVKLLIWTDKKDANITTNVRKAKAGKVQRAHHCDPKKRINEEVERTGLA